MNHTQARDDFVPLTGFRPVDDRPCVICRDRAAQRTYLTCGTCSEHVLTMLDEVGDLYAEQVEDPEAVLPVATGGSSSSRSYRSASPTSLRRIDLVDRRADIDGEARDVHGILIHWSDGVRASLHMPTRPRPRVTSDIVGCSPTREVRCVTANRLARGTVHTELAFLRSRWWWIRAQPAAARFARQLTQIRNELLDLARERAGLVRIGRCITTFDGGTCGQLLLVRLGDNVTTCPRCGVRWPFARWPELKALTA